MNDKLKDIYDRIESISGVVESFNKKVEASETSWECVKRALEDVVMDFKAMKQRRKQNGTSKYIQKLKTSVLFFKVHVVKQVAHWRVLLLCNTFSRKGHLHPLAVYCLSKLRTLFAC